MSGHGHNLHEMRERDPDCLVNVKVSLVGHKEVGFTAFQHKERLYLFADEKCWEITQPNAIGWCTVRGRVHHPHCSYIQAEYQKWQDSHYKGIVHDIYRILRMRNLDHDQSRAIMAEGQRYIATLALTTMTAREIIDEISWLACMADRKVEGN